MQPKYIYPVLLVLVNHNSFHLFQRLISSKTLSLSLPIPFLSFQPFTTMSRVTLPTLENAARDVILFFKNIPELADARVAILGGMAVCRYLPNFRSTEV